MGTEQEAARQAVRNELARRTWVTADLARAAGVDAGTVGDFLSGKRWPRANTLAKLDAALEWQAGTIDQISRTGNGPLPKDPDRDALSDDELQMYLAVADESPPLTYRSSRADMLKSVPSEELLHELGRRLRLAERVALSARRETLSGLVDLVRDAMRQEERSEGGTGVPAADDHVRPLRAGGDVDGGGVPPMPDDLAAMEGEPGNPPDTKTGEETQTGEDESESGPS